MEDLSAFRLFVRVIDGGSFSEAARRHGGTPSAVSRRIAALEDALGSQLLNRTTRRLHLTEAGEIFLAHARRILDEVDAATRAVTALGDAPRGILRVNASVGFGRLHLARLLPEFMRRYPEVEVEIELTERFVDVVAEGVDVAIRIGALEDSSLVARRLAGHRRVICAAPSYLERHGTPERPRDLAGHNCLSYQYQPGRAVWHFERDGRRLDVRVAGSLRTNDGEPLRVAAVEGVGITFLAAWIAEPDIRAGRLVTLFPDWDVTPTAPDTAIWAVMPPGRHQSPKVKAFVAFLVESFHREIGWE